MEIVVLAVLLFASFSALGLGVVGAVLIRLPATYFCGSRPKAFWSNAHPVVRWTGLIFKNIAGAGIVLLGLVLTLPGVPGPGVLTVLLGIMVMGLPGRGRPRSE